MECLQMAFPDLALCVPGQLMENLAQVTSKISVEHLLPVFRDENHVVFTIPSRMRQTSIISHLGSPSCFWLSYEG
jgi:hypothetical protein